MRGHLKFKHLKPPAHCVLGSMLEGGNHWYLVSQFIQDISTNGRLTSKLQIPSREREKSSRELQVPLVKFKCLFFSSHPFCLFLIDFSSACPFWISKHDNIEFELFSIDCSTGQYFPVFVEYWIFQYSSNRTGRILENIGPAVRAIQKIYSTNIAQPGHSAPTLPLST